LSTQSPDVSGHGLVGHTLDPLRYNSATHNPYEVTGILHDLMPSGVRVLDIGCGAGVITLIANEGKSNTVYGVEPDPDRAKVSAERGLKMECGLLDSAYFERHGRFDVIMLIDVLEHLVDPQAMLALIKQGLNPGGRILLSVPNVAHWSVRLKLLFGRFDYTEIGIMDATHLRWFYEGSLRALVESQGFTITDVRQSAGTFLWSYSARPPFKWLPAGLRDRLIGRLTRLFPGLFGFQHVVSATLG